MADGRYLNMNFLQEQRRADLRKLAERRSRRLFRGSSPASARLGSGQNGKPVDNSFRAVCGRPVQGRD